MSDDEADRTSEVNKTVQLHSHEVEELGELPGFPHPEDFVKTQEMDSMSRNAATDRSQASLETTQRYDVPEDLLQMAMRSQEMEVLASITEDDELPWREFVAVVDPRGRIVLPSRVQADLRGKKLRVKYLVDE